MQTEINDTPINWDENKQIFITDISNYILNSGIANFKESIIDVIIL